MRWLGDARSFDLFVDARRRQRAHGARGRGRRLRRLHPQDRERLEANARRRRRAAQLHQPAPRRRTGATTRSTRAPSSHALERIGYRAHPFAPERAEADEARQATLADALPRGRGLRRHEHHAAVGVGMVRQRLRHDAGDARLLPLALGADRAAGRRLCRPAVLPERAAGRSGRGSSTWTCRSRSASCSRSACRWSRPPITPRTPISTSAVMLLFFLLCGRYLDHAMRRKTRAVAGNLAALKAEVAHRFDGGRADRDGAGGGARARRPPAGAAGRTRAADGTVDRGPLGDRRQPDHRRDCAPQRRRRGDDLCRQPQSVRHADAARDRGRRRHADRRGRAAAREGGRDAVAICGSPTVRRGSTRRWCTRPRRSTAVGWLIAGASLHDAIITAIAVLIITCPCALALAIPAVQVVAAGALFRAGMILNAGDAIERLAEVDTVVFDKTGTLTLPEPRVVNAADIRAGHARDGRAAGAIEPPSAGRGAGARGARSRPLRRRSRGAGAGRARRRRRQRGAARQPGLLRRSRRRTSLHRPSPARPLLPSPMPVGRRLLAVRQTLRPDAVAVATALRERGLDLVILSGDRAAAVAPVAAALGISELAGRPRRRPTRSPIIDLLKAPGPPRPHGRRRPQRRAGARCRACVAVADQRRRPHPGAGRRGLSRRAARARSATPSRSARRARR